MITEKEVEHIAGLARLKLNAHEKEKFQKELSLILDYIAQLKEVVVENVLPTFSGSGTANVMRSDEEGTLSTPERTKRILGQAPAEHQGFVKVGAILKK